MKGNRKSWFHQVVPAEIWRQLRAHSSVAGTLLILSMAFMAAGAWYILAPARLAIALPPGAEANAMRVFARALAEHNSAVRLDPVDVADFRRSGEALEQGKVQLAVVQPDIFYPANGGTVALLRQNALIVVQRSAEKTEKADKPARAVKADKSKSAKRADSDKSDDDKDDKGSGLDQLTGKHIVVLTTHQSELTVVRDILAHYGLAPPVTSLRSVAPEEVGEEQAAGPIDALVLVATPGTEQAQGLMHLATQVLGDDASIVPLEGADILARKLPDLSEAKLPPRALGRLPKEEVTTVALSYRLVAANSVDRGVISNLAELLFQMRARIARAEPAINLMEAPDDDTSMTARLPNHRGAVDYLNREQVTFMTRYGDWIWLGLFAGGGITSAFGWAAQMFARKRREAIDSVLDRLLHILGEARQSHSVDKLNELALEIDSLVGRAVRLARKQTTSTRTMSSLMVALDGARSAVADRRRELLGESASPAARKPAFSTVEGSRS